MVNEFFFSSEYLHGYLTFFHRVAKGLCLVWKLTLSHVGGIGAGGVGKHGAPMPPTWLSVSFQTRQSPLATL